MANHTTETLSERNLEALAVLMADNPDVWNKLAEKIAEKVGDRLYERGWSTAGIERRLDKIDGKVSDLQDGMKTLTHNVRTYAERQETLARDSEKRIERKLVERFTERLGVPQ